MAEENKIICLYGTVRGRVQGVWYRGATQQKALDYGVVGWAKNLPDGRVEVMLQGDEKAVRQLQQWLDEGPPLADVLAVELKEIPVSNLHSFDVR